MDTRNFYKAIGKDKDSIRSGEKHISYNCKNSVFMIYLKREVLPDSAKVSILKGVIIANSGV